MLRRALNASWPLLDQGVVSLGTFGVNVILARGLPPAEYGVFALLISVFMTFQLLNTSLIFHPLMVSLPSAEERTHGRLLTATCLLTLCASLPLAGLIAAGLVVAGRGELVPCALAAFLAAQGQEAPRRCLFAELRHRAALPGDAVSYLGQCGLVLLLVPLGALSIANALMAMAATSLAGMVLQLVRIRYAAVPRAELRQIVAAFWIIGRWILAYSAVTFVRLQIFPWTLAGTSGPAAAALFQASMNVLNVVNPMMLGLSNIVPQVAARAHFARAEVAPAAEGDGAAHARSWRAVKTYLLLGMPVVYAFYGLILVAPEAILRVFYGAQSEYLVLAVALRILAVAGILGSSADMLSSFLHGVNAARTALAVNAVGAAAVLTLALPAIALQGLTGCCFVILAASAARLASAHRAVARLTRGAGGDADLAELHPGTARSA